MDAVPHEVEGGHEEEEARRHATEVVHVLNRVHAEAAEGLDVRVPVVQTVHVLVQHADMNETVCEVEVEVAPYGNCQRPPHSP